MIDLTAIATHWTGPPNGQNANESANENANALVETPGAVGEGHRLVALLDQHPRVPDPRVVHRLPIKLAIGDNWNVPSDDS